MKLPEFKSTTSASMGSAMMTAQLRPMTKQNVAPQHNLTAGFDDPNAAAKNAMAKYGVGLAVAEGALALAGMYEKIDDSAQTMAMEKAAAEYTQGMGAFQANEVLTGGEIDPDTNMQRHYGAEERYNAEKERLTADILSRNKFSKKELVHDFGLKVSGADYSYRDKLTFASKQHEIEKGKADYITTLDSTVGEQAKVEVVKKAVNAQYITRSAGATEIANIRIVSGLGRMSDAITQDKIGTASTEVLVASSDPDFIAKYGIENSNRIAKQAARHKGLLMADTIVQKNGGSVDALTYELGLANNMSLAQLQVETLEQKDMILDALRIELSDVEAGMLKVNKESKAAHLTGQYRGMFTAIRENNDFGETSGYQGVGLIPGATANSIQSQYDKDITLEYAGQEPLAILSGALVDDATGADAKQREMAIMRSQGVISTHILSAWDKALGGDPTSVILASSQISEVYNDPTMSRAVKMKMQEKLGTERIKTATYLVSSNASESVVENYMRNEQQGKNLKGSDADITWKAVSADHDFSADLRTRLNDMGIDASEQDVLGAGVSDLETMMRVNQKSGKYGNNMKVVGDVSMVDWAKKWGVEKRPDGSYQMVKDSFVRETGGVDGQLSPNAVAVVDRELAARGVDMERVQSEREDGIIFMPMKISEDLYAIARMAPLDDTYTQDLMRHQNGRPLVVNRNDLVALDTEQNNFNASVARGKNTLKELDKTHVNDAGGLERESTVSDFIGKEFGATSESTGLIGEVIGTAVAEQYTAIKDGIINVLHRKTQSNPAERERLVSLLSEGSRFADASWVNPELNDEIWYEVLAQTDAQLNERERAQRGAVTDDMRTQAIEDTKSVMMDAGLKAPRDE